MHAKPETESLKPEWLNVKDTIRVFGLCRTTLSTLIREKTIVSRSVRQRNSVKGTRLINFDSLNAYIESCPDDVEEPRGKGRKK